ncbi:divergent polysaccharide deacetylase family protein [bacterium]
MKNIKNLFIYLFFVILILVGLLVFGYNYQVKKAEKDFLRQNVKAILIVSGVSFENISFDENMKILTAEVPCNFNNKKLFNYIDGFFGKEKYNVQFNKKETRINILKNKKTKLVLQIEQEKPIAYLSIVLDDVGYSLKELYPYIDLNLPITFAIFPNEKFSKKAADLLKKYGFDYILHQPMEAFEKKYLMKNTLSEGLSESKMAEILENNLKSIDYPWAINNHMGSKFTSNPIAMKKFLNILKDRNMVFLDSKTSYKSVTNKIAKSVGARVLTRNIFLDQVNNRTHDFIRSQFLLAMDKAEKIKYSICIGHITTTSIYFVAKELLDEMNKRKIKIINLRGLYNELYKTS